jgi:hypothetical protein
VVEYTPELSGIWDLRWAMSRCNPAGGKPPTVAPENDGAKACFRSRLLELTTLVFYNISARREFKLGYPAPCFLRSRCITFRFRAVQARAVFVTGP